MVRKVGTVAVATTVLLALGLYAGRAPFLVPAGADPVRARQVTSEEETFFYAAAVPPGGVATFERPTAGKAFLITDVLVQNQSFRGELTDLSSLQPVGHSVVTVGVASRRGSAVGRDGFTSSGLQVRVAGAGLEQIHLEAGFVPVNDNGARTDALAVANSGRATVVAFVQIFGRLIDASR